jgi:hypothetical protein
VTWPAPLLASTSQKDVHEELSFNLTNKASWQSNEEGHTMRLTAGPKSEQRSAVNTRT